MFRKRFTLAVIGTVFALCAAASDVEARHCQHQRHHQQGCCHQSRHTDYVHTCCGYSGHNHQQYGRQWKSNACRGTHGWHQNGGCHNQLSHCHSSHVCCTTSASTAPVSYAAPATTAPQPAVGRSVVPTPVTTAPDSSVAPAAVTPPQPVAQPVDPPTPRN